MICKECGSPAELHLTGPYKGIWGCKNPECQASDNHEHTDVTRETIESRVTIHGQTVSTVRRVCVVDNHVISSQEIAES